MTQEQVYQNAGFGAAVQRGESPAVLAVDFSYGFTDTQYPTASQMFEEMAKTTILAKLAREKGFPVIYTTIAYDIGEVEYIAWLKKAKGMASLLNGSRLVEIDEAAGMLPQDSLIVKKGASAFFGTSLASLLVSMDVDTLIVTGATTSGCIRASVVDAVQSGFQVLVPKDCVADRAKAPHDASLYDMHQKYADVTDFEDVSNWLSSLKARRGDRV